MQRTAGLIFIASDQSPHLEREQDKRDDCAQQEAKKQAVHCFHPEGRGGGGGGVQIPGCSLRQQTALEISVYNSALRALTSTNLQKSVIQQMK